MTRLWIPNRFVVRTVDEFVCAYNSIGANYWYLHATGDVEQETLRGRMADGAFAAAQWLAGARDIPPGFHAARLRTRYDLLDVLRVTELAATDEIARWEDAVRGGQGGADEHFDAGVAAGAREVYQWMLRMTDTDPVPTLLPEQERTAQRHFARMQSIARGA